MWKPRSAVRSSLHTFITDLNRQVEERVPFHNNSSSTSSFKSSRPRRYALLQRA